MGAALTSLDPMTLVMGALVCFAASALGGMSGMGAGMIVTLFITPIIGPKAVVPVISVLMLINNASRVWFYREALVPAKVALVAGVAVPMSALGALIYVRLDGTMVQIMLGAILIASVPFRRWMAGRQMVPSTPHVVAVSGLFGFLSSLIVGAGALVIPMLMGFGMMGPALLATDAAIAVLVNLAKVALFGSLEALSLDLFVLAIVMGICTVPGTWVAAWIVRNTALRLHTLFIEALIIVGGLVLIRGGVVALLGGGG